MNWFGRLRIGHNKLNEFVWQSTYWIQQAQLIGLAGYALDTTSSMNLFGSLRIGYNKLNELVWQATHWIQQTQ